MSEPAHEPEHLLASLLSDEEQAAAAEPPAEAGEEDVDALIDELEALANEGRRRLLGRKLMIDEDRLLSLVDRFRSAVPTEVRQAHRVLDEHDRIVAAAQAQAQRIIEERGLLDMVEAERRRVLEDADREADKIRSEADRYAHNVLVELEERLAKLHTSVRNGIAALGTDEPATPADASAA